MQCDWGQAWEIIHISFVPRSILCGLVDGEKFQNYLWVVITRSFNQLQQHTIYKLLHHTRNCFCKAIKAQSFFQGEGHSTNKSSYSLDSAAVNFIMAFSYGLLGTPRLWEDDVVRAGFPTTCFFLTIVVMRKGEPCISYIQLNNLRKFKIKYGIIKEFNKSVQG